MRILQVGKHYYPVNGGMERVVRELSEGLAERGNEVQTIVSSQRAEGKKFTFNDVRVVQLPARGRLFSQPLFFGLKEEIRRFDPDVVHFHLPNPLALVTGFDPTMATCLTLHAQVQGWKGKIDRWITQSAMAQTQSLIFSSRETADLILRDSPPSCPVQIIPFGFQFDCLDAPVTPHDSKLALFVGRLVPYKGVDVLIEAMSRVDGKLVIVGDGPMRRSLEKLVVRLGLEFKVKFAGSVLDAELREWYKQCAVVVQPSVSPAESFGVAMLEAMSCKRPVISTDLPTGVRTVNRHLETGLLVRPSDVRGLAAAINTLLKDSILAQGLGELAYEHAMTFSREKMIDAHVALYESLVGRSRPRLPGKTPESMLPL